MPYAVPSKKPLELNFFYSTMAAARVCYFVFLDGGVNFPP
jgi:hypothetical protein